MNRSLFEVRKASARAAAVLLTGLVLLLSATAASAQVVIVGLDDKAQLDQGKLKIDPNATQSIAILGIGSYGISVRATLPIPNSIFGPPTNLQITPDEKLALVAEAVVLSDDQ